MCLISQLSSDFLPRSSINVALNSLDQFNGGVWNASPRPVDGLDSCVIESLIVLRWYHTSTHH